MVHDIHRVRELSALLEERRRYFDGQLGEVYRNAGVSGSGSNNALPRLRGMDSPPVSATPSESNVTGMSLMGSTDMSHNVETTDIQSACSGRSYSVFADDECSVADSFEFSENQTRMGGRSWNSSSMLAGTAAGRGGNQGKKSRFTAMSKDTIHNEVMRTADLEKKLKARRSSLPLALEASLKRPLKKKVLVKTSKGLRKEKGRTGSAAASTEDNLSAIASTLLTKDNGYPDSSSSDDEMTVKLRHFSSKAEENKSGDHFSMTDILRETRKFDMSRDLKAHATSDFSLRIPGKQRADRRISWDTDIMGVAPRLKAKQVLAATKSSTSKSVSSPLAPMMEYSPRSSLSTLSGSYPKIAFSSLEKIYREEGDKSKFQLHPSSLLLKPVPKIDMNLFAEQTHAEPDYSHDFRYLSLLDALVPCFEPAKAWRPAKTKKSEDNFFSGANSPYRFQRDTGLSRLFPC